jgi:exonuclease III
VEAVGEAVGADDDNWNAKVPTGADRLRIFAKNVMSLGDDRLDELVLEVADFQWDIILLTETWRKMEEEVFELSSEQGRHLFIGAGGKAGERGVACLVHCRWKGGFYGHEVVSERLLSVDINIKGTPLRFVVPYMPHGGYADCHVDHMYVHVQRLHADAKRSKRRTIIGGDFNAVTGSRLDEDEGTTLGLYGMGCRNARGEWMLRWMQAEGFIIANTKFKKMDDHIWTYVNDGCKRQIDSICAERSLFKRIFDAEAGDWIRTGLDYKSVRLDWYFGDTIDGEGRSRTRKKRFTTRGRKPVDSKKYAESLDGQVSNLMESWGKLVTLTLDAKCQAIEGALFDTALLSRMMTSTLPLLHD